VYPSAAADLSEQGAPTSTIPGAGIITKTDVVRKICLGSGYTTAASDVMMRNVILCHPSDLLRDVRSLLQSKHVNLSDHRPSFGNLNNLPHSPVPTGNTAVMAGFDYDVVIIGSGFGGSVAALRAAEKGYRVGVMEAGKRWPDENIPRTNWDLKDYVWFPAAEMYGRSVKQIFSLFGT